MGWNRIRIRATASLGIGAIENLDFTGVRGATRVIIAAKAGDANTIATLLLQRKDAMGPASGVPPFVAQDGFANFTAGFVTESGDTINANPLNNSDSGTVAAGRYRTFDFLGVGGCPVNTLRCRITGGAAITTLLTIDAFVYHPSTGDVGNNLVAD